MAGLAKAMAAIQQMEAKATSNKKNFRLIADPCISVESLKRPLRNYLEFHKSSDMWSLVCPPPGGPLTFTWHTPPNGSWLSKCIGLLYDLLEVAPNSKLQSVKLLRALKSLVEDKTMSICTRKMTESDVLDRIDLSIRLLLSHLRQLKQNLSLKLKVLRMCTDDEKMKKINLTLDKLELPMELLVGDAKPLLEEGEADGEEENASPVRPCTTMVVYEPQPAFVSPLPQIFAKSNQGTGRQDHKKTSEDECVAKGKAKAKVLKPKACSPKAKAGSSKSCKSKAKAKTCKPKAKSSQPDIAKPGDSKTQTQASKPEASKTSKNELDILAAAMNLVPDVALAKKKAKNEKKQPKIEKKTDKKDAVTKKNVPKKEEPKKPKAEMTDAKMPKAKKLKKEGPEVAASDVPFPKLPVNYVFEATTYGECKVEFYKQKSYIRNYDAMGKKSSIISSCHPKHHTICEQLVPHVKEGKSLLELYQCRIDIAVRSCLERLGVNNCLDIQLVRDKYWVEGRKRSEHQEDAGYAIAQLDQVFLPEICSGKVLAASWAEDPKPKVSAEAGPGVPSAAPWINVPLPPPPVLPSWPAFPPPPPQLDEDVEDVVHFVPWFLHSENVFLSSGGPTDPYEIIPMEGEDESKEVEGEATKHLTCEIEKLRAAGLEEEQDDDEEPNDEAQQDDEAEKDKANEDGSQSEEEEEGEQALFELAKQARQQAEQTEQAKQEQAKQAATKLQLFEPAMPVPTDVEVEEVPPQPRKKPAAKAAKTDVDAEEDPQPQKKPAAKEPAAKTTAKPKKNAEAKMKDKVQPKQIAKAKAKNLVLKKPSAAPQSQKRTADDDKGKGTSEKSKNKGTSDKSKSTSDKKSKVISSWATPLFAEKEDAEEEGGEEEEAEVDEEIDVFNTDPETQTKKDRAKDFKFKQMYQNNQLPDWLAAKYRETLSMKVGRVEQQRKLVNMCLDRTKDQKLVVNLNKPMFKEMQETWTKIQSKKATKTLSKTLFCGKFNLTEDAFQAGLQAGEFYEVTDENGTCKYGWDTAEHSETKAKKAASVTETAGKISKEQQGLVAAVADKWSIGLFRKASSSPKATASSSSEKKVPLAIMDQQPQSLSSKDWEMAKQQLHMAQKAFEQIKNSAQKLLTGLTKEDKFYDQAATSEKVKIDHIHTWQELPDGSEITTLKYDEMMLEFGTKAEQLEEQFAAVKAQHSVVSARKA
ncbi:unnamed protein product [Symbiodinium natans]|uniref:Uncharacterized protein n=1 Tax=Symbiodinium natans TaxID=878477 RepID=A0A812R5P9_9DINO|nr:unnamed protein product [Symbiodinium natans]